ncbi:MAG: molybdopterin-binding protein [Thermomicrobiales bacterium]
MDVSARNQLAGKVTKITLGGVMAEVTVDIGDGKEVVAAITRASVERMELAEGTDVLAIIKATEVLIGKP